ncbi:hypothetical protein ACHAPJ_009078 [Fusarium lateritium]
MAAVAAAQSVAAAAAVQAAAATAASEAAIAGALAAEAAGALAAAEAALTAAAAAETAAITATAAGVAATNIWNPVGWAVGAVLVGALQDSPYSVTWGCYRPIIGESDHQDTIAKPMAFVDLISHPMIHRVCVSTRAMSTGLPNVEIENKSGELYILSGVVLPWGSVAYHADRVER